MIIAVGFKVNNAKAVQFRKWANQIVEHYTIKGWVMDDERLTNAGTISMEVAQAHAIAEWEKFRIVQDRIYQSDFDNFLELKEKGASYKA